jgi:hypothetical protein
VALAICTPAIAGGSSGTPDKTGASAAANCPRTTSQLARENGRYSGKKLAPQKLTELPPGTAYMAVYRRIDGCEAPLTMVEYRNPRRR